MKVSRAVRDAFTRCFRPALSFAAGSLPGRRERNFEKYGKWKWEWRLIQCGKRMLKGTGLRHTCCDTGLSPLTRGAGFRRLCTEPEIKPALMGAGFSR